MSISGIEGDFSYSPDFSDINEIYDGYIGDDVYDVGVFALENRDSFDTKEIESSINKRAFIIGLVAGAAIMAIAIVIAVLSVHLITGIPQTLVMGIALAGFTAGGVTIIRNAIDLIKLKRSKNLENASERKEVAYKTAAIMGSAILSFGLALRLGSNFIMSPFKSLVNNLGTFTNKMGISSLFFALGGILFENIKNPNAVDSEKVSDELRNKRIITAAGLALTVGIVFIVLGIIMLICGSMFLVGVPQAILLTFAAPLISLGVGLTLRLVLGFPIEQLKRYLKQRKERDLVSRDIEGLETENAEQEIVMGSRGSEHLVNTSQEETKLILPFNEKVTLIIGGLLLLASVALVVISAMSGLANFQIILLSTFGGAGLSFSVPLVLSGMVKIAAKLKIRGIESRMRRQGKMLVLKGKIISKKELMLLDQDALKRIKKVDLNAWGLLNKKKEETEGHKMGVLFGAISILIGIGVALFPMISVIAPFSTALLALGTPFMVIGLFMMIGSLIDYLKGKMLQIRNKRVKARKDLNDLLKEVASEPADLETDLNLLPEWNKVA